MIPERHSISLDVTRQHLRRALEVADAAATLAREGASPEVVAGALELALRPALDAAAIVRKTTASLDAMEKPEPRRAPGVRRKRAGFNASGRDVPEGYMEGQAFEILGLVPDAFCQEPVYRVRLADGHEADALGDEIFEATP